jgi:hypothetical protein
MGLTARKPTEAPNNVVTIAPVARPALALITGVSAAEDSQGQARQNEHGEDDAIRRRREAFLSANLPNQAAGWVGLGSKLFYQGRHVMTVAGDQIAVHDATREVLAATIAVALKQGWQEIAIDSKDPAVKQALVAIAHEAGLRVSGVQAPAMKESASQAPAVPGMC